MTTNLIYKVARPQHGGGYRSIVGGWFSRRYELGRRTDTPCPEAPLLGFRTLEAARELAREFQANGVNLAVLKCECGEIEDLPMVPWHLRPDRVPNEDALRAFWERARKSWKSAPWGFEALGLVGTPWVVPIKEMA